MLLIQKQEESMCITLTDKHDDDDSRCGMPGGNPDEDGDGFCSMNYQLVVIAPADIV